MAFVNPTFERKVGDTQTAWIPSSAAFSDGRMQALAYLRDGIRAPDGTVEAEDESVTMLCGSDADCTDDQGNEYVALVIPFEARWAIEGADLAVTLLLAAGALVATGVLVARRRPD